MPIEKYLEQDLNEYLGVLYDEKKPKEIEGDDYRGEWEEARAEYFDGYVSGMFKFYNKLKEVM